MYVTVTLVNISWSKNIFVLLNECYMLDTEMKKNYKLALGHKIGSLYLTVTLSNLLHRHLIPKINLKNNAFIYLRIIMTAFC